MPLLVGLNRLKVAPKIGLQCRHQPDSIAKRIGSSAYAAIANDALKDEDNAGWVMHLETSVQQEWIERMRWIRVIDRLAEAKFGGSDTTDFQTFVADWQQLQAEGTISPTSPFGSLLTAMRDRWFHPQGQLLQPATVSAWNQYVEATATYSTPHLEIATCSEYEQLLAQLAGSFFQVLPFLANHHQTDAHQFGMVDQFYNHLRDLQEDLSHGMCYLPLEVLHHFDLSPADFSRDRALQTPNYYKMMQFWLDIYLPRLRRRVRPLLAAKDLHPSWQILCDWSLHRYRRIEQVFRECNFDYTQFPHLYWKRVRSELPLMLATVHHQMTQAPLAGSHEPLLLPSSRSPIPPASCAPHPLYSSAI